MSLTVTNMDVTRMMNCLIVNEDQMQEGNLQDWAPIYFKKRSFMNRLANRQDFLNEKVRTLSYLRNFLIWINYIDYWGKTHLVNVDFNSNMAIFTTKIVDLGWKRLILLQKWPF